VMSHGNAEIVEAAIDAYNRGDWDAVLQDTAPGFEFDLSRSENPDLHGVFTFDQMRRFFAEFAESWESVRIEPHDFIEASEYVVVPWTMHARGRDGIDVQTRVTWVWTIRDGAIVRASMYQERQDALEAVGMSEQDAHPDSS
jgi:ketosteroid isomerase-like protein